MCENFGKKTASVKSSITEASKASKKKSIKIDVTEEEHDLISTKAAQMKFSIRSFVKTCALDCVSDTNSAAEMHIRQIIQRLPELYNEIEKIEDPYLRSSLKRKVGELWQR